MQKLHQIIWVCGALCTPFIFAAAAGAHGFVGPRFFPATLTTDDPFAVDELSFGVSYIKNSASEDEPSNREFDGSFEFVKEIFPRFAIGVAETYIYQDPEGESGIYGWDNLGVSVKYELWRNDKHEAIFSIGLDTDIGGTGAKRVADRFTTFTPSIFFGKGFGDLPDSLSFLKPFAITGVIGEACPTSADAPNALEWGFALEYNLIYLQKQVKDIGLPAPFKDMVLLVEFSFESPQNRGENVTTGSINPGVIWVSKQVQLGVEALIPINHESGSHVGVIFQVQIFIDDLAPSVFGHPLFGHR